MENIFTIVMAVAAGALIAMLGMGRSRKSKKSEGPPENAAAAAARGTIQQTFEDEVDAVKDDLDSDDPAGALASRGNARRRRRK
jgi:hypothetical protein